MSLSDVLGADAARADVGEVYRLAARMSSLAGVAESAHQTLGSTASMNWSGRAATDFQQHLGRLPGELSKVNSSFTDLSKTLTTYASRLETLLSQGANAAQKIDSYQAELASYERQLAYARDHGQPVSHIESEISWLRSQIKSWKSYGSTVKDELKLDVQSCISGIAAASAAGIQNTVLGSVKHFLGDVAEVAQLGWNDTAGFRSFVAHFLVDPVKDFATALRNFVEDPGWRTFAALTKATSNLAGEIALVVGVAALALTGVGSVALVAALTLTAEIAGDIAVISDVAHLDADSVEYSRGEVSAEEFEGDAIGVGVDVATLGFGYEAARLNPKPGAHVEGLDDESMTRTTSDVWDDEKNTVQKNIDFLHDSVPGAIHSEIGTLKTFERSGAKNIVIKTSQFVVEKGSEIHDVIDRITKAQIATQRSVAP
jgi:hypothetical protein